MYNLPYFKEEDNATLLQFIHEHPFAFVTGNADGRSVVTQIPLLTDVRNGKLFLQGHIMRQTDHHQAFLKNPQVLAVFTGPHTYVSATWYTNPHQGSTWNYMSVHLRGTLRFRDEAALMDLLRKLSLRFENGNTDSATIFDNLPDEYRKHLLPAIVAFEIEITEMENVFKLSQNRDEKSFMNIIIQLEKQGGNGALIAVEMKKRIEKLFPAGKKWDSKKFLS